MAKQIVRSGLILACGLLATVAYMTATDQTANSSSGSAVQQPAVAVFRFVPQSESVTESAAVSPQACAEYNNAHTPAPDAVAAPNNVTVDHSTQVSASQAQNAAFRASLTAQAAGEPGTVDVAAVLARLNQHVSELSEQTEAAIVRYPTMLSIFPFGGPMFVVSPRFPWGESIPIPRIALPRVTYTSSTKLVEPY